MSVDAVAPVLVTGPARSGKSEWAERLAKQSGRRVVYIATASEDPSDADWSARIEAHRRRRPPQWITVCAPTELASAIEANSGGDCCLLVDSLGTWIANLLEQDDAAWQASIDGLLDCLSRSQAVVILVAEETGWGVIPAYPLGRQFRDRLGALIRRLGPRCSSTYLVTAGHAIDLARLGVPID
ncbi:MAG: bifunctional adenosylcobinamide kinase/adenosylcobinamide-phosphate guanylyltransferase [Thiohalocapsa sp.]